MLNGVFWSTGATVVPSDSPSDIGSYDMFGAAADDDEALFWTSFHWLANDERDPIGVGGHNPELA